jgi:hypothetical protein
MFVSLLRRHLLVGALIAVGLSFAGRASAQTGESPGLHLLIVSVCPPYRKAIPVEVCRNSAKKISDSFAKNLGFDPQNIHVLVDEASTGAGFLNTLENLKQTVSANDRIIVYLQLHGDAFHLWANYYRPTPAIQAANQAFIKPDEDILVFWTAQEPSIPAIAIAQKDWLTADEVVDALDSIEANVSLILDSCSSGLFFAALTREALASESVDYILTSAGAEQVSNFDDATTVSIFARELSESIDLPTVRSFGEAVEHARLTTVLSATAKCSKIIIKPDDFELIFPHLSLPSERTFDGKVVPPLWYCAQVPSVVDLSGQTSALTVY